MGVVVATRFFETKAEEKAKKDAREKILKFSGAALAAGAERVLIAVNVGQDVSDALNLAYPVGVMAFPVQPWGKFAPPLNGILTKGRKFWAGGDWLLLASAEVVLTKEAIEVMVSHMTSETLVVGAALEGHQYEPGFHNPATGRQTPWNTLALYNASKLWNGGGFPIFGDGPVDEPANAGVEEVVTIAMIQSHAAYAAKMVKVPGQKWDTSGFTDERLAAHEKKMTSKNSRPARQLEVARFQGPMVLHI
ncbi:MAG: hypothetical protein UU71_C0010G0019 [Parcubacteria group bacterium GW2011_GWB1_41_6]|nr:MAG: hypothetical protein UU71_C0010G0019 [Parcubacteria group bacterium GW2011_GWB1_41_6]KKS34059.1 MAG: hypothetical protein UU96_C0009G0021 [Parcubacteria group bacterium GW2011_GWC2_42_13]KKS56415.1 MAG: hypothetical protein UV22_C0032G0004 [Parcubacteria group bacterium GW2011_GWA2_42_35]